MGFARTRSRGFDIAKIWKISAYSKYLGEIFPELLRQGGHEASKAGHEATSCRILVRSGYPLRGEGADDPLCLDARRGETKGQSQEDRIFVIQ